MGKVIEFLARAGSDAALRHASADVVRIALLDAGVDDVELGRALSGSDGDALRALLGRGGYCCSQMPDDPQREEDYPGDEDDENGDGEPDGNISRMPPEDPSR
ncbi:hypothetical protein [Luteibacter yeojuensis]|uniref:Uncharacterized protein n=1 Tax=Luteibacter yeojuensis TaxID=345309 RepID=A0A7X5TPM1_9GAMM|nr:hypothetical protein [Luteibacter yeojuensis]NID14928.1 hypothetical protein [Luteibacter yeojuensis]